MCEQPKSSDESAHLSSLACTFATPIQNIRAFRSHRQFRHAIKRLQESSDEYARLSSLAKAFATPIQNISAFRRQRNTRDVGFHGRFIACASNESSESAHYSSLVRASTTSVHLGDVDTQLFIAFSNHESTGFHCQYVPDLHPLTIIPGSAHQCDLSLTVPTCTSFRRLLMRGSRKFCKRGSTLRVFLFFFSC